MSNAHPLRPREKSAQVARDRTVAHLGAALGIDEARRVRVEAEGLALPLGAFAALGQEQEPERTGGKAG
jgi:hypothetical protein